ncbi:O-fucosyltransferase 36-like [Phoenix dactylifera]|uniref:GDP-fucose protein O-fucosyltransferase 2 n=1 Tax=Phoenix dactylifera TaxID=42345 RepID=A0A8B7CQP4_PHODC|nr:O-fucosyltransferase 36-like [Phoenix dactylifera]
MERDRSSDSSSDEEEERGALVPQNEVKTRRRFAAFEIGDLPTRIRRGFWTSKRYLLVICLPLVVILLFFSLDLGSLFRGVSIIQADSTGERMRESELRAIHLLRNQQLGFLRLWNRTLSVAHSGSEVSRSPPSVPFNSSNSNTSGKVVDLPQSLNSVSFEEFRLALLEQIKLNKQIQNTLLSTHRVGNASLGSSDDNVDFDSSSSGVDVCRKVERPAERRTIEWKPQKDRYLFAICLSGQMSNHLICLEKHMFFAALLGRTLIFPSSKLDYQYDRVLDIDHINECFGRKVVITFEEFHEMKNHKMRIDRFICYIASPPCYLDGEHIKRLEKSGISLGKIEAAWPEDAKLKTQKKRVVDDIVPKFSSDDEVLAIGDMFYADVEEEWVMQPGGPLAHKCKTVIQPSRLIILTAQRFVQTFLGSNYIALHFRRHGFLKFCNVKKESCFYPIPQAAECILRVVERANAPVIYLSTDAATSETDLLQSLVVFNDKPVPLVKRPAHASAEKWDALLYRNHIAGDSQVEAMLDKTICALSNVFIGASGSTFTEDIIRLRRGWESASQCDEYLCQGELPNYIAELQ